MANLILTICSNHKCGGGQEYGAIKGRKMADMFLENAVAMQELTKARNRAFDYITEERPEKPPAPISMHRRLRRGPDINPGSEGRGICYLPALKRYAKGRFYKAFHQSVGDVDDCIRRLDEQSDDHLLIVSGLYGLLTPTEPIQNYSCNVSNERGIKKLWKEDWPLTQLIIAYIRAHKITRVFDFMADDSYRHLIDWESIKKETGKIFFSYGKNPVGIGQLGVDMLPELGWVAGLLLTGKWEKSLSKIQFGDTVESVVLTSTKPDWIPAGIALSKREKCAVWAIRMATNIEEFLAKEGMPKEQFSNFEHQIGCFCSQNENIGEAMHQIRKFRNDVVHHHWYDPAVSDITSAKHNYIKILNWAKARAKKRGEECIEPEDVDH